MLLLPCACRAKKLLNLRIFENPEDGKPWDKSVKDLDLEVLCVSQVSQAFFLFTGGAQCPLGWLGGGGGGGGKCSLKTFE